MHGDHTGSDAPKQNSGNRSNTERPATAPLIVRALYVVCAILFGVGLFVRSPTHFNLEDIPGFYELFGFVAFVGIVFAGALLRKFVGREEDYYDE